MIENRNTLDKGLESALETLEQAKQRVANAYSELYDITDVLVVDAGRYGFVKLQYFNAEKGFNDAVSFLESRTMFDGLRETGMTFKGLYVRIFIVLETKLYRWC